MITTVSPTYAQEIQTEDGGFGLDGLLRVRKDVVRGVLNGCDLDTWNPKTDKYIPYKFDSKNLSNKAKCKAEVQKKFNRQLWNKTILCWAVLSRQVMIIWFLFPTKVGQ